MSVPDFLVGLLNGMPMTFYNHEPEDGGSNQNMGKIFYSDRSIN
jgi:hypothetical protein